MVPRAGPIFRISTELRMRTDGGGLSMKPGHFSILYVLITVFAVLTTWATGFWRNTLGGFDYGFPLPWKTVEVIPVCSGCPLPTSNNWSFFIFDAVFYAAIYYGIVLLYARHERKRQAQPTSPT
jgi:hypothetical protein